MLAALMGGQALGSIASGYFGSQAAGKASAAQGQAAQLSSLIQAQQAEQARQDILRGQSQAATALREAQAPTLGALQTSSQQAQDLLRGGTTAASQELQTARQAAIDPLLQSQRQGLGALRGAYREQGAYQLPYFATGTAAQNQLANLYGLREDTGAQGYGTFMRQPTEAELPMDPGYNFRFREGQRALEQSAAARGGLLSGGAGKALARYGQEAGSQEYQNAYARFMANRQAVTQGLQGLAGSGQTAANVMANAAGNYGTGAAGIYGNTGANISNIQSATGQNLANLQAQQGTNLAANVLGTGQNVANVYSGLGTNLANVYTGTAPQLANINLGVGQALGTGLENAAQARASGYMGGASALGQALQGVANTPMNAMMAYGMYNRYNPRDGMSYGPQQDTGWGF